MHWILLRGLTREQAHWGELRQCLSEALPDQRFHLVDLPGTGVHFKESSPWTIAGIRQRVQHQVAHIPEPYGLIGLSMGGMVALDWVQYAPQGQIQQLVLINTSSSFSPPWQRMKPSAWPRLVSALIHRDVFRREAGILALTSNRPVGAELVKRWYSIQRQRPVSVRNALRQITAAARYKPADTRPLPDALILASAGDRIVDSQCSIALQRRWQWTLKLHPDAGHDLPLDEPAWVAEQIAGFLRSSA